MTLTAYHALTHAPIGDAPLVFAFHGTGGNEQQFSELVAQMLPGSGLVSPRGDVSEHGALRFFRRTGEGVYDMDDLATRTEAMAAFMAAHKAAKPGRPVYALGYSNGANILASVMFKHAGLVDRAALLHPLIPFAPEPNPELAGKPILITAGERDPICPLPLTRALIDYLGGQGARVETSFHSGGHEIRQEELVALKQFLTR